MRAPEVKMALAMNFLMILFFGGMVLFRHSSSHANAIKPFIPTGVVAFMFLGMLQLLFNQFGYDRAGFRVLVLSPAPRRWILMGKNLGFFPIVAVLGGTLLVLVKLALNVPLAIVLSACVQMSATFLLLSMVGNLVSVLLPNRIAPGSLKPTKMPTTTVFLMFFMHMLFPLMMVPMFLVPLSAVLLSKAGWLPVEVTSLALSIVLLILGILCYRLALPALGDLLQQREKKILDIVTHEVE
jgi:ABC-2 type transport system permease protein